MCAPFKKLEALEIGYLVITLECIKFLLVSPDVLLVSYRAFTPPEVLKGQLCINIVEVRELGLSELVSCISAGPVNGTQAALAKTL